MHWRRQHEWQVFERTLSLVLRAWTNTPKYLRSVVEGAPMIGLDGEIVDTVSSNWAASARREEQRKGPPQQDEDEDNENKQNENKLVRKLYERLLTGGCT
jgi:sRNA-binding protein